jgi:hypothetical protein
MKIAFLMVLISTIVQSSEVDSFTHRYNQLNDELEKISEKTEEHFDMALIEANQRGSCSEKRLYKSMRRQFRNHVQGKFNRWLAHTKDVQKNRTKFDQSIYADFKWHEAYTTAIKNIYKDTEADLIKVNGHLIGTDKFEHFFGRGYAYYVRYYRQKKSLEEVLKFGHRSERYILGANTTGIYSYGDLASNFIGMRFWNHLLQKNDDILGKEHNLGPLVLCQNGRWVKNKLERKYVIDWTKYINAGWDEGNNCAKFRIKSLSQKVTNKIHALNEQNPGLQFSCPIEPEKLQDAWTFYGDIISPWIFNPGGHDYILK